MVTITLPPELERIVTEQAAQQGTTPELVALDKLRSSLLAAPTLGAPDELLPGPDGDNETMLDFFAGYVGVIDSSEFVPGGAQMSQNTGEKFAEGMLKKRREGRL